MHGAPLAAEAFVLLILDLHSKRSEEFSLMTGEDRRFLRARQLTH